MGLGKIDNLSMEPHSIPKVKKIIRLIRLEEARQLADHVLNLKSNIKSKLKLLLFENDHRNSDCEIVLG